MAQCLNQLKSHSIMVLLVVLNASFVACTAPGTSPGPTPDIPYWGSTPVALELIFPRDLDCSRVPTTRVKRGPSWRGVTIGVSSLDDLQAELAPTEPVWDTTEGNLRFRNEARIDERDWDNVKSCFTNGTLSVLYVVSREVYVRTFDDWLEDYGPPDRVTWGADYYNRSIIWAEEGILIVIDAQYYEDGTGSLILFSPIPSEKLEASWLMSALPSRGDPYPGGDLPSLPDELEKEDPWGIQR